MFGHRIRRYVLRHASATALLQAMKINFRPKAGRRVTEETRCNDCDDEEEMLGLRVEDHYHALYEERMNPFDQVLLLLLPIDSLSPPRSSLPVCLSVCVL
jgi:hypothetical protein